MHLGRTTLSKFLIQQLNGIEGASDLGALLSMWPPPSRRFRR